MSKNFSQYFLMSFMLVVGFFVLLCPGRMEAEEVKKVSETPASLETQESFFQAQAPQVPEHLLQAQKVHRELFSFLAKSAHGSVVNIVSESKDEISAEEKALQEAFPFFRGEPHTPLRALGSGFVIHENGLVATNAHVVFKASRILVKFPEDREDYEAELVGADEKTDLALIKLKNYTKPLHPLPIGDSDLLEVGESVLAIGYQFQLGQSVTTGVVSALSRKLPSKVLGPYDQFIQTDASINPGSSGGPLLNVRGEVIGINTAIFSPGRQTATSPGFNIGIGFAIPMNQAKKILLSLHDTGKVTRAMLGVVIQEVSSDIAKILALPGASGALVADVVSDSPAQKAGFQRRDVILKYGEIIINTHDDLPRLVAETPINKEVSVELLRDGKIMVLRPVVAELKDTARPEDKKENKTPNFDKIGIQALDGEKTPGVQVQAVRVGSAAFLAGVQKGDRILEINREVLTGLPVYQSILERVKTGDVLLLLLEKKEGTRFVTVTVSADQKK